MEAVTVLHSLAAAGHLRSFISLGECYEEGFGVMKDENKAFQCFLTAAERGDDTAQVKVGMRFKDGIGTGKDEKQAVKWYRKAAEQNNSDGQNAMGVCRMRGVGLRKDEQKAITWFRKAASFGSARGRFNLAFYTEQGRGTETDAKVATVLYRKAAEDDEQVAQFALGMCLHAAGDEAAGSEWYRKSAEHGFPPAKTAVVHGNAAGIFAFAESIEQGTNLMLQDDQAALFYYRRALAAGYSLALSRIDKLSTHTPSTM